jgi:hypothetical protein
MAGEVHVIVWVLPAFAFGLAVFELTVTVEGAVHPLAGSVTVKVYVPAALTVGVAVVPPETIPGPDQLNVAPAVDEEPFNEVDGEEHEIVTVLPAFEFGVAEFEFTAAVLVDVHPFEGSVTDKVYVPAVLIVGVAVVPPETIPGPDQLKVAPAVEEEPLSVTVPAVHVNV